MSKSDERMTRIRERILDQARRQALELTSAADLLLQEETSHCKEHSIESMYHLEQQAVRRAKQDALSAIARVGEDTRRAALLRRMEMIDDIMGLAAEKLLTFTETPAYGDWLLQRLSLYRERYDHSATTVRLRPQDEILAAEIRALLPGCTVLPGKEIRLGGFLLENRTAGVVHEETLEAVLEEQRPWLLETCGLRVREEAGA